MGSIERQTWRNTRGVSLIEALFAVAIISAVAIYAMQFFSESTRLHVDIKHQSAATLLVQKQIQQITQHPFNLIQKTAFSDLHSWRGCSCSYENNYDTHWYPPQTQVVDGTIFTVYSCVGQVQTLTNNATLTNQCPDYIPDTGLRRVHVTATWSDAGVPQQTSMDSLVSREIPNQAAAAWTGDLKVKVCAADKDNPSQCDTSGNPPSMAGAEITISKLGVVQEGFYGWRLTLADNGTHNFLLPQDDPYDVRVFLSGYFTGRQAPVTVLAGSPRQITIPLRSITDYGSNAATEVFIASQPVIAQILCHDPSNSNFEALELYNPTVSTVSFDTSRVLYTSSSGITTPLLNNVAGSINIPPKSPFLILGTQNSCLSGCNTTWGNVTSDMEYLLPANPNLIDCSKGSISISSGSWIDRVGWGWGAVNPNKYEGQAALGNLNPALLLSRADRRGFVSPLHQQMWAASHDTHNNRYDFSNTGTALHGSAHTLLTTGLPAIDTLLAGATIQYGDPTSPMVYTFDGNKNNPGITDRHWWTGLAHIGSIMGPDGFAWQGVGQGPPNYLVTVVSNHQVTQFFDVPAGRQNPALFNNRVWGLVANPAALNPPANWCTSSANCDADGQSVPATGNPFDPNVVDYTIGGYSYPDENSPYTILDSTGNYVYITGVVRSTDTLSALPGIPVSVVRAGTTIPLVTKLTDNWGVYKFLVASSPVDILVNLQNTTVYRPWYKTLNTPPAGCGNVTLSANDFGGLPKVCSDAQLPENTFFSPPAQTGTGCIQGTVNALETGAVLSSVTVHATDMHGAEFYSTLTAADGTYRIPGIPTTEKLIVSPVVDRNQSINTTPTSFHFSSDGTCPQILFPATMSNFVISGMSSLIQVTNSPEGSIIKAQTSTTPCALSQVDQSAASKQFFSAVVGPDQAATLEVPLIPITSTYQVCCWVPRAQGGYQVGTVTGGPVSGSNLNPGALQTGAITCQ